MARPIPSEEVLGGILFPPAILVCILGLLTAFACAKLLNWSRLSRHVWNPPLVFMAMWVFFSSVIGLVFIAP